MTSYTLFFSNSSSSIDFSAPSAVDLVEKLINDDRVVNNLSLGNAAGYILHGLRLSKAAASKDGRLTRQLEIDWQSMQTLPQEREGRVNPVKTRTIYLQHGSSDDTPEVEWEWVSDGTGKLTAQARQEGEFRGGE